jgi:hypothetical protein
VKKRVVLVLALRDGALWQILGRPVVRPG